MCLLPAVLMAIPLLARRYPGERRLLALRRKRALSWPHARSSPPARNCVILIASHGGQLIARSLAVRPPPASLPAS